MDQLLAILLGLLASYIQGNDNNFSRRTKYIMALSASVLTGFLAHSMQIAGGEFNWHELLANIGIAFTTSQTYYNTYFKKNAEN